MKSVDNIIYDLIKDCSSIIYENEEITDNTSLVEDLGFDSVTIMQLVIEIEEKFNIRFDEDTDFKNLNYVNELIEIVKRKIIGE